MNGNHRGFEWYIYHTKFEGTNFAYNGIITLMKYSELPKINPNITAYHTDSFIIVKGNDPDEIRDAIIQYIENYKK